MKLVGPTPVGAADAINKSYFDAALAALPSGGGGGGSLIDTWAGVYDPGHSYTGGEVVTWHGSTWLATTATTGATPTVTGGPWALLAGGLHLAGEWDPGVTYQIGEVVTWQGSSFVGLGVVSGTAPADTTYWMELAAGGAAAGGYQHVQSTPAAVWQISHALGFDPAGLTVISAGGDVIDDAVVQYLTPGQTLRLSFDISIAGTAYLS